MANQQIIGTHPYVIIFDDDIGCEPNFENLIDYNILGKFLRNKNEKNIDIGPQYWQFYYVHWSPQINDRAFVEFHLIF